ncbi:MAG: hypothetical protein IID37_05795 [Planctomycetes bacterium]|nr:hypothetical protein [Planctomycetota bacterium]
MNNETIPVVVVSTKRWSRQRLESRGWGRPPGLLLNGLAKLWLVAVVYYTSNVAAPLGAYAMLLAGLIVLAGAWVLRLVVHATATVAGRLGPADKRRWRFLTVPMVVALGAACVMFRPALIGRVLWSQVGLTMLTDFQADDLSKEEGLIWIGFFQASEVETIGSGTRFITYGHGTAARAGLAYFPGVPPPAVRSAQYEHIYGEWWAWYPNNGPVNPEPSTVPPG